MLLSHLVLPLLVAYRALQVQLPRDELPLVVLAAVRVVPAPLDAPLLE